MHYWYPLDICRDDKMKYAVDLLSVVQEKAHTSSYTPFISPLELRNLEKESSPGYNSVPKNNMCSQKCAKPGISTGSEHAPTCTDMEVAADVVVGSEQRSMRKLLVGKM